MQIGNWVLSNGEIVQVKAILEGHLVVKGKEQRMTKDWQPVKLTAKILSRFDLSDKDFEFKEHDTEVSIWNEGFIIAVDTLHDLQNIFQALTKRELKTKA